MVTAAGHNNLIKKIFMFTIYFLDHSNFHSDHHKDFTPFSVVDITNDSMKNKKPV